MVSINKNAQLILDIIIEQYADFRYLKGYGTSPFWWWYYQVRANIMQLDKIDLESGENLVHKMNYWGDIIYNKEIINGEVFVIIINFKFNDENLWNWIHNSTISNFKNKTTNNIKSQQINQSHLEYTVTDYNCHGYRLVKTNKGLMNFVDKNNKLITNHWFSQYKTLKKPYGVNKVFVYINVNGKCYALGLDKQIYHTGMKWTDLYTESIYGKTLLYESQINNIIKETLYKYIYENRA